MRDAHPLQRLIPSLLAAAWLACAAPAALAQAAAPAPAAASAPTVRPETAKPLGAAQEALRAGNAKDALARLAEAEALPGLTPYEQYVIRRLKAPASYTGGEPAQALLLFEGLINDPFLPPGERNLITETTIKVALQQKDFGRAARWMKVYLDGGGTDPDLRRLYPQVLAASGDHAGAAAGFRAQIAAEEAAGRSPTENQLVMLASSQGKAGDQAGYMATLERLAATTGKPDYWNELIARTTTRNGFATDRLQLDVYRLRRAVGVALNAGELGDMAYRANQSGYPAEAQALLDEGFDGGLLGKDNNAAADRKLREQATRAAAQDRAGAAEAEKSAIGAKDGNAAFGLGLALSAAGQHERALSLMAQGQAKGGLRRPDEAQLHLGLAHWRAGKVAEALKAFGAVGGSDGAADLARLWSLFLKSPARRS